MNKVVLSSEADVFLPHFYLLMKLCSLKKIKSPRLFDIRHASMKLGQSAQDTRCSFPFARLNSDDKIFADND